MNAVLDSALQFAFSVLLNSFWEGIAIALLCALILRFTPQMNATTRASVLTGALLASIILPFATAFLTTGRHASAPIAAPASSNTVWQIKNRPTLSAEHTSKQHVQVTTIHPTQTQTTATPGSFPRVHLNIPRLAIIAVVGMWLIAALVALIRLSVSLLHLEKLKHDALPLAIDYRSRMERWTQAAKGGRGVRLCRSPEIVVPIAVGLFDAMILVPETLLEELSPEDVDRILLHELAHLRRGDDWINAVERIAQALFFFNPGIQWIVGQLDLEREVVCDDWVLNQTAEIRQYATCLARVAEITAWPYRAMTAPGAFITRRSMSIRVERLLQAGRDIRTKTSLGPAGFAIATLTVLCILAAFVSPSIAFTTSTATREHAHEQQAQREKVWHEAKTPVEHSHVAAVVPAPHATPVAVAAATAAPEPSMAPSPKPAQAFRFEQHAKQNVTVSVGFTFAPKAFPAATSMPIPAGPRTVAMTFPKVTVNSATIAAASSTDYIDDLAAAGYRNLSIDDLIRLKSVGVTGDYIRGLESAGLSHPSVNDLAGLASLGITPDYVRAMRRLFPNVDARDLEGLKAVGVDGAYIDALQAAGYTGLSARDVQGLRAVGVDPSYIRDMRARVGNVDARDLEGMRAVGVTPDYVDSLRAAGYTNLSAHDLQGLRAVGVDGTYVAALRAAGYTGLSPHEVQSLRAVGVDPSYIRDMRAKLPSISARDLESLRAVGVTPDYVDSLRAAGYTNLSASSLTSLRALGVDGEYVKSLRDAGYPNLSASQLEQCRALGIDGAFVRNAAAHGFHNLSIDQLVRLKTSGLL